MTTRGADGQASPAAERIVREQHEIERSSHAVYGLIIITATLVADRVFAEDAIKSLLALWGAAAVLALAHVYSAAVAEIGEKGRWLTHTERHVLIADNIPVLAAVIVPSILLLASVVGWLDLTVALNLSVVLSVAGLFIVGVYQARGQQASTAVQVGLGSFGGLIGIIIIVLEVAFAH